MANAYEKSIFLGIVAGMRSMSAPALLSAHYSHKRSPELDGSLLSFIASRPASTVLTVLAVGELAADKSSFIGSRTEPGPLAFRALSGAVCGAAVCTAEDERVDVGAAVGAIAAIASAFAFYHLRRSIVKNTGFPDTAVALAEDALALGVGFKVLGR